MIKVCHITSAHKRYDQRILRREAGSLAANGYEVYLVVNDDLPDEQIEGVNICSTGKSFRSRKKRMTEGVKSA